MCRGKSGQPRDWYRSFTYNGEYERVKTVQSDPEEPSAQTIYINPGTQQVPFYEVTTGSSASTRVYVSFAGKVVSQVRTTLANGVMQYHLMTDSQGSIISEGAYGNTTQDMSFDAWGKTRNPDDGSDYGLPPEGGWAWHNERLYTGHESHQDQYVINMNGRLYDPVLSRMMSADPFVPGSGNNPQGLNRYAYVFNNPLRYTDPDGFKPFWKNRSFMVVAAVVASVVTMGAAAAAMTASANAAGVSTAFATIANVPMACSAAVLSPVGFAAAGAAGGFMGGLVASGGNLEAAFNGAMTGAAFGAAGSLGSTEAIMAGHAAAGCLSGVVQGGGCGRGAASAVVGKAVTLGIGDSMGNGGKFVAATVAGGISSRVAGGNFAAGAQTAAFGYLFNYCAHNGCFNRRFNWNDAVDQWRNGNGSTVTDVQASELNLTDAAYTKNADGSYQIHTSLKFDTGAIYGTVTGVLDPNGALSIKPDYYDFDVKNPYKADSLAEFQRIFERNAKTGIAIGINGPGTPYSIEFTGSIPAPMDLPR